MYSQKTWEIISGTVELAEDIHKDDYRKNDWRSYFNHNIEIILDELGVFLSGNTLLKNKYDLLWDFLVYALHDAPEDHPERWRDILNKLNQILDDEFLVLQLFRDILILATGGIPLATRSEMVRFFLKEHEEFINANIDTKEHTMKKDLLLDIVLILSPANPLFKLEYDSEKYGKSKWSQDYQRLERAIRLYKHQIILRKGEYTEKNIDYNDEYIWLGNYIFFNETDARRKLKDMFNNMSDMVEMDKKKPGYIETRRIKAYILSVKLKHFGMLDELHDLEFAFQKYWYSAMTDSEVNRKLRDIKNGK